MQVQQFTFSTGPVQLEGLLELPAQPRALLLFAHGSASSAHSPRNNQVARALHQASMGTLLLDLLSSAEQRSTAMRFDITLLTERLGAALDRVRQHPLCAALPLGLFGASTGAAAALRLAAARPDQLVAVVARGGRPDLAGANALACVRAPTLLIVGGQDALVIDLNLAASALLQCENRVAIVPGAGHLFEEPGTLEAVAELAAGWFVRHLPTPP